MGRLILTDNNMPEVCEFVRKNRKNASLKISTYSSGIEGMRGLENSEFGDRDVMVFFFTGQSDTVEMMEKIKGFRDSHSKMVMIFVVSDCSMLSELYKLSPAGMFGLSEMEDKLIDFITNYNSHSEVNRIRLEKNGKDFYIDTDRIATIYKCKRKSVVVLRDGTEIGFRVKLGDVLEKLPDHFVDCHISHIVNLRLVESFADCKLGLSEPEGYLVPVSRAKKNEIKAMLKR